ncbi:MAG: DUF4058 family protein [Isosphaeraceae bacterium]
MPSPFPGMDPYLEDPGLWPDLHHRLITLCSDVLVGQVRPRYFVRIEERVYVSDAKDPGRKVIAPDLMITMRPEWRDRPFEPSPAFAGEIPEPVSVAMMLVDEIHEPRVEIVDREIARS